MVPPSSLPVLKLQQNHSTKSPSNAQAHGIVVLDCSIISIQSELSVPHSAIDEDETPDRRSMDSGILVFPPSSNSSSAAHGPVNVLINGESTLSCPPGRSEHRYFAIHTRTLLNVFYSCNISYDELTRGQSTRHESKS